MLVEYPVFPGRIAGEPKVNENYLLCSFSELQGFLLL